MQSRPYRNLIPDSPLHRHLEQLLREQAGRVSLAAVCDEVLRLPVTDDSVARTLVQAVIEDDSRMHLVDGHVEWHEPAASARWHDCRCFAVLDLETTNGPRNDQRIIEIGVCRVEDGRIAREWAALVDPQRPIPYWVRHLTGISEDAVREAPRFEEVLPRLLDELEDAILVAHHARFDVACLNAEVSRLWGMRLVNPYLCTVELARRYLPGSDNYRLETLGHWLGLTHEQPHRAPSDARATAELLCRLLAGGRMPWQEHLRPRLLHGSEEEFAETKPQPIT